MPMSPRLLRPIAGRVPPAAPTGVSATAGDTEATVVWSAPNPGTAPITDYIVQYSSDSGATWTTFSDGTSTATTATVTGLTNGTAYIFRVAAVSAVGTGPYSAASEAVTPVQTTPASLLLKFDGTNGSTSITDSSSSSRAVTAEDGAEISTADAKFGGSSLYLPGSGSCLRVEDEFSFGTGDFTVEAWVRPTSAGGIFRTLIEFGEHLGSAGVIFLPASEALITSGGASAYSGGWYGTAIVPENEWSHIAWVRTSGVLKTYLNGVADAGVSFTNDLTDSSSVTIGDKSSNGSDYEFIGYIDDLRIVGIPVYDGDFVPPSAALSASVAPYSTYKPYGTLLFSECSGGVLTGTYADGNGGRYTESLGAC